MTLASFLHFVELRTKVASVLPFLFGTLYALWRYGALDPLNLALMLAALLCIDMATTASNHYTDYLKAVQKTGYNYERHNTLVRDGLSLETAFRTIVGLVVLGMASGLLLALRTDGVVLAVGVFSFGVGLLYSWGPIPISRTPFGEAVSGLMMGFVIVFLSAYIHVPDPDWVVVGLSYPSLTVRLQLVELGRIFLVSLPLVFGIANIMLSNNICDQEEDRVNGRLTLPILIGRQKGLKLSAALYGAIPAAVTAGMLLGWLPLTAGVSLLGVPVLVKHWRQFAAVPTKEKTFVLSVKSFLLTAALYCIGLALALMLP